MNENHHTQNQQLITAVYTAFNARDIDAILPAMTPDIEWPKAFEGGYIKGHEEIRAYWERQWKEINPVVIPVSFKERADNVLTVEVDQLVKDLAGNILFNGKVKHIYTIEGDLLRRMDIELF